MSFFSKIASFVAAPAIEAAEGVLFCLASLMLAVEHAGEGEEKAKQVKELFLDGIDELPIPDRFKKKITGKWLDLWIKAIVWNGNITSKKAELIEAASDTVKAVANSAVDTVIEHTIKDPTTAKIVDGVAETSIETGVESLETAVKEKVE